MKLVSLLILLSRKILLSSALGQIANKTTSYFRCDILLADVEYEKESRDVGTREIIACLVNDMVYGIPEATVRKYKSDLTAPGDKAMFIQGGSLPVVKRTKGNSFANDEIVIPNENAIYFRPTTRRRQRSLQISEPGSQKTQGNSEVLVIRVVGLDAQITLSDEVLSDRIFGDGSNFVQRDPKFPATTLVKTYRDCSMGKLNFSPAQGYDIVNGVGYVEIDMSVRNRTNREIENAATTAINKKYGNVKNYDHIIYCLPRGTLTGNSTSWIAYGYTNFYRSIYNDLWCGQNSAVVHEIGHNIGLYHSNEKGTYKDQTCLMGYSFNYTGGPLMCFNAHKHWFLGWFSDRQIEIDPNQGPWQGRLLAFPDYPLATEGDVVIIHFGDVYIQYNRAKGINAQVQEKPNQVIVVQMVKDASELISGMLAGSVLDYGDTRVEICSMMRDDLGRDYAIVQIALQSNIVSCTPPPTPKPTLKPTTPRPTRKPTPGPTPPPFTLSPSVLTLAPTSLVTQDPSVTPFAVVAPIPAVPTSDPISIPSNSPLETGSITPIPTVPPSPTIGEETPTSVPVSPSPTSTPVSPSPTSAPVSPSPTSAPVTANPTTAPVTANPTIAPVTSSPTTAPVTPSPTTAPVTINPTIAPSTHSPTPIPTTKRPTNDVCDDDPIRLFWVPALGIYQKCVWLKARPEEIAANCPTNSRSDASIICPETCGVCTDNCVDDFSVTFIVDGLIRSCAWLDLRPQFWDQECQAGKVAWNSCKETCGNCPPMTAPPTNRPTKIVLKTPVPTAMRTPAPKSRRPTARTKTPTFSRNVAIMNSSVAPLRKIPRQS